MNSGVVDRTSLPEAKIALFRSLFRVRDDVYARRFESKRTGKSGYVPACANEWVRGICEKPRVKCAACPLWSETERRPNCGGSRPLLESPCCRYPFSPDLWSIRPLSQLILRWPLTLTGVDPGSLTEIDPANSAWHSGA